MKFKYYFMFALIWVSKGFLTVSATLDFINTLPLERAIEAKIIACNSQRMFFDPYIVFYREESK